jgi:hypothetical protein
MTVQGGAFYLQERAYKALLLPLGSKPRGRGAINGHLIGDIGKLRGKIDHSDYPKGDGAPLFAFGVRMLDESNWQPN